MIEDKTLNDLPPGINTEGIIEEHLVSIDNLKAEAVKWINWLNTLQGEGDYTDNELECMKQILMDFFNLTEEDLK